MRQPYQLLFPIGLLYGLWGVALWLAHVLGWVPYPGPLHAHLMVNGFLFSFALGFLMTAIPRFTGAEPARGWELGLAVTLAGASFLGAYSGQIALATLLFLSAFFARRFLKRAYSPPPHFIFVPLGLLSGIAGAILMIIDAPGGRVLLYHGTMLCFVLGIGGKLVSALLGWGTPPLAQISKINSAWAKEAKGGPAIPAPILLPFGLLAAGLLIELTPAHSAGSLLRALAATFVAFSAWKLHRRPNAPGRLAHWLWVSAWGLVLGLWLGVSPALGIHGLHLAFICGFGLMTLMVASRVTLAHGGYGLELELKSRPIRWAGALTLAAALTRLAAPFTGSYFEHLAYAAFAWIAALAIWSLAFLPRIWTHASRRVYERP